MVELPNISIFGSDEDRLSERRFRSVLRAQGLDAVRVQPEEVGQRRHGQGGPPVPEEVGAGRRHTEHADPARLRHLGRLPGMNCVKIGLRGELILSKRKEG